MATTTTTTTTTLPLRPTALYQVETINVSSNQYVNASGNKGTITTMNSSALSFGALSAGELSETKIIYLRVPFAKTIDNIKLALINTGEISFQNNIFGIVTGSYIDRNIIPSTYFAGLNEDDSPNNAFNISIPNNDNISSQYVYINVNVPTNQGVNSGVIRLKWYFNYA